MANKATITKSGVRLGVVSGGRRGESSALKVANKNSAQSAEAQLAAAAIETPALASVPHSEQAKDYFVERNGIKFAGTHLLVELWDAKHLDNLARTDDALREAAHVAGATLLHIHLHHFSPNGGLSGVAVLAESHISIHTWPERGYAAIDIFMCGVCDPYRAIPVLRRAFEPGSVQLSEQKRGIVA
jgi:S-adenosylmethionine decarboxylase